MKTNVKKRIAAIVAAVMLVEGVASCSSSNKAENVSSYIELAESYRDAGDIDKAIETLEDALKNTDSAELRSKLSEYVRERSGVPATSASVSTETKKNSESTSSFFSFPTDETSGTTSASETTPAETTTPAPVEDPIEDFKIEGTTLVKYVGNKTDVVIPKMITVIGEEAFEDCKTLTSVIIPESVTSIENRAFYYCENLKNVTIPDSVTNFGWYAFTGTPWLDERRAENPLVIVNNILIDGQTSKGDVIIPIGVERIGEAAFRWNEDIRHITIPDSVKSIGLAAFQYCKSLTDIKIPDGVTIVEADTFYSCQNLTNVSIPYGVTSIGSDAFYECKNLEEIILPDSVTNIGHHAFAFSHIKYITIPYGVTSIEESTFAWTYLETITIPDSVTTIGERAFSMCGTLKSIIISDSVKSIEKDAFNGCYYAKISYKGKTYTCDSIKKLFK